jgi:hypothetical protein
MHCFGAAKLMALSPPEVTVAMAALSSEKLLTVMAALAGITIERTRALLLRSAIARLPALRPWRTTSATVKRRPVSLDIPKTHRNKRPGYSRFRRVRSL